MSGETDLQSLLSNLTPVLTEGVYVFCLQAELDERALSHWAPLAMIREPEGWTLVLPLAQAQAENLHFEGRFRCIRLDVHSSLEAVGLTAAVSTVLAQHGISANMLAGFYHDQILVPEEAVAQAMRSLQMLQRSDE